MSQGNFVKGLYLVPALPHILQKPEANAGYKQLRGAYARVAEEMATRRVKRIVYYSTGWIAVLGQMIQAKASLKGFHVDENWYEHGNLNFDFSIDREFAYELAKTFKAAKHSVSLIDYEGFPVDTGTIVADTLLNPHKLPTLMIANHVYTDLQGTQSLAALLKQAIEAEQVPTAVVAISGLSGRFFTDEIDWREDAISSAEDDDWNKKLLSLFESGSYDQVEALIPDFAKATKADMGFKAFGFVRGLLDSKPLPANVLAYSAIYGTGAAVVSF